MSKMSNLDLVLDEMITAGQKIIEAASASHRWINCPPSAKLCESIKDEASSYAQEGTDCHELCAYLVEKALGKDVIYKYWEYRRHRSSSYYKSHP